eukprot:Rhum_TRINITY_DN13955_c0_g2::Rhum_TRINITY_DN13955_c0_g2_i1::g.66228::m.66228
MRRCRFVAGVLGRGRTPSSLQGCAFGEASGGIGVSSAGGGGGGGEAPWSVHARTAQRMRATEREERKRESARLWLREPRLRTSPSLATRVEKAEELRFHTDKHAAWKKRQKKLEKQRQTEEQREQVGG